MMASIEMEFTLTYLLLSLLKVYIQIENYQNSTHNMMITYNILNWGTPPPRPLGKPQLNV